jgi:hypothetical protein
MTISVYKKVFLITLLITSMSCLNDTHNPEPKPQHITQPANTSKENTNLNISLLLDLSDRINPEKYPNPAMEYYQRDAAYIAAVSEAFQSHLSNKKIISINERIQLFFEPEPLNPEINSISKNLKFDLNKTNISNDVLSNLSQVYQTEPLKIYELAIQDDHYVGSDTWSFFKNKVKDYSIAEGHRNILVVLTDGYMFHVDNRRTEGNKTTYLTPEYIRSVKLNSADWATKFKNDEYGFIPATENLENLEVLVLGINPDQKNEYEGELIKKYWADWFEKMGVKRYEIKNAELPSNMEKIIQDFILKA